MLFKLFLSSKDDSARLGSLTEDIRFAKTTERIPSVLRKPIGSLLITIVTSVLGVYVLITAKASIGGGLILIAGLVSVVMFPYFRQSQKKWRLTEEFERDYPAFLLSVASAVKTGLDPLDAIAMSYEMFPTSSPVHHEAKKVGEAIRDGLREDDAVKKFGGEIPHPDIRLFHDSFVIARQCGASLAPALHRLAKFTRQRQSFRRKSRAAVAMQRLSSYGIMGCCVAISAVQVIANPKSVRLCFDNQMGALLLSAGMALMILGMGWMMYMTRRRI